MSSRTLAMAVDTGRAIALEDLMGIRERTNREPRTKTERRRSNAWAFYQLRSVLAYKCVAAGVPLVLVNPAYTSQMCHTCLHMGERSGKKFACLNAACRWCGDADLNGAKNIAVMGLLLNAPHGPWSSCPVAGRSQGS